jgi:hypothetical protein
MSLTNLGLLLRHVGSRALELHTAVLEAELVDTLLIGLRQSNTDGLASHDKVCHE